MHPPSPSACAKASTFAKATVDKMVDEPEDREAAAREGRGAAEWIGIALGLGASSRLSGGRRV